MLGQFARRVRRLGGRRGLTLAGCMVCGYGAGLVAPSLIPRPESASQIGQSPAWGPAGQTLPGQAIPPFPQSALGLAYLLAGLATVGLSQVAVRRARSAPDLSLTREPSEQEHELELAFRESRSRLARLSAVFNHVLDGIAVLDPEGTVQECNFALESALGRGDLVGVRLHELLVPSSVPGLEHTLLRLDYEDKQDLSVVASNGGHALKFTLVADRKPSGELESVYLLCKDQTLGQLQSDLERQALHDALTGLPNRLHFEKSLEEATRAGTENLSVLFVDLDNFKHVNDSLGHAEGDKLLRLVAERLKGCVRPSDLVARIGGDEFTVLLQQASVAVDPEEVAQRMIAALKTPFRLTGRELLVTCSIGVARGAQVGQDVRGLLRDADTAMYQAKARGKSSYVVFDDSMTRQALERQEVRDGLVAALEHQELRLVYQPIVELKSGQVVCAEALLRWQHPSVGIVSPDRFIKVAEESGLIVPIGAWVLEEAVKQSALWTEKGIRVRVNVNFSQRQLQEPGLVEQVRDTLARHSVHPSNLCVEVTESSILDSEEVAETLSHLRALGVWLALDDFGTGYSSLRYLQKLPIDLVKFDRSFVSLLEVDHGPEAMLKAIVTLCDTVEVGIAAEGIETEGQFKRLLALSCDLGQGHYFSKPLTADAFECFTTLGQQPGLPAA